MRKEKLTLGNTYYFNNREVVLLRMETETIAFCVSKCDISHNVTGSCFCEPCNIDSKSSHVCDEYDEAIEAIMEDISDEQVLWIPIIYLKDKPIEFKENNELLSEIELNKKNLKAIKEHYSTVKKQISDFWDDKKEIIDQINSLELKRYNLGLQVVSLNEQSRDKELELNTVIKIKGSELSITAKELHDLYKSDIELKLLHIGKVNNWEWYSEALGDVDIESEALNRLIKQ